MGRLYLDAFEGGSSLADVSAANAVPTLLGVPRAARQEADTCWFHSALCPQDEPILRRSVPDNVRADGVEARGHPYSRKEFRPETRRAPITHSSACERSGSECTSGTKLSGGVKPAEGAQVRTCSGPGSRASRWAAAEPAWCNRWEHGELPRAGQ
ncbi:hypothetical protein J1605_016575 [Eschrichtius robustus]|uniref:Uncharacterized protein n=1 Tax=Eschrichtius robustus TaxID=9764 RepID=A0AB34I5W4_ESCRO|nr:hypothetical protein J1605_016575 [Eschrichtius robustus]